MNLYITSICTSLFLTVQTQSMVNFCNLILPTQQFTSDRSFPWSVPTRKILSELFSLNSFIYHYYIYNIHLLPYLLCIIHYWCTCIYLSHVATRKIGCAFSKYRSCWWNCKFLNHYYSTLCWNALAWTIDKLYCTKKWTY